MVQIYAEPLYRRHYSDLIGDAVLLRVVLFLTAIAVSLVVAFATGGFWVKVKPTQDQPTVHFTYDALLMFQSNTPQYESVWSTSSAINQQYANNLAAVSVQVGEEDWNFDGKPDAITFTANLAGVYQVYGVKAMLQFNYSFWGDVRLQMFGLAYLEYNSIVPGGKLYADGSLLLNQKTTILDRKFNGLYNVAVLNSSSPSFFTAVQPLNTLDVPNILKSYNSRNYTTTFSNVQTVWQASPSTQFQLEMYIRIPPNQIIWYRPQVIEMLKFGWIQFLATYVCLWWLFWWFQRFVFKYRLVTTHVVSDVQPKAQRF